MMSLIVLHLLRLLLADDGRVFPKIKCRKCGEMGHHANHCSSDDGVEEGLNALNITAWNA